MLRRSRLRVLIDLISVRKSIPRCVKRAFNYTPLFIIAKYLNLAYTMFFLWLMERDMSWEKGVQSPCYDI